MLAAAVTSQPRPCGLSWSCRHHTTLVISGGTCPPPSSAHAQPAPPLTADDGHRGGV